MPVPWNGLRLPVSRIFDIEKRAITIRQLRDMRSFLIGLCKTGLLKHTMEDGIMKDKKSQEIDWFEINLYDVTDEVIKKVIQHVDPHGARDSDYPTMKWYSWTEFVANGEQLAKLMISHWWGGRFFDFMNCIETLSADSRLSTSTPVWICTFACNQFGEDLGDSIKECPFIKVINLVDVTVLVVDRLAGSLKRTWCGLELYHTTDQEKELRVYTASGIVGGSTGRVSSGPLVEAVKWWDIRATEASEAAQRRQILNYIVHPDNEKVGVLKDEAGREILHPDNQALDDVEMRINKQNEYQHEAKLFKTHAKCFETLNMMVRLQVMAKIGLTNRSHGCSLPFPHERGIRLGQLRSLLRKAETTYARWRHTGDQCRYGPYPKDWADVCLIQLDYGYIKPQTKTAGKDGKGCSYMELVSDGPQIPQIAISESWTMKVCEFSNAIEWFADANHLLDSTTFVWDMTAMNQHEDGPKEAFTLASLLKKDGRNIYSAWAECESLLVVCTDQEQDMHKLWLLVDFELSARFGLSVYLSCPQGVLAATCPFPGGGWKVGSFDRSIAEVFQSMTYEKCCINKTDPVKRQKLMDFFASLNAECIPRLFSRLRQWTAGPIMRAAARSNKPELIHVQMVASHGLELTYDSNKGGNGETPLHLAASHGSLEVIDELLRFRACPNVQDSTRQTPLHYAVLAGQSEAVCKLLAAGANPHAESCFLETPLEVGDQNPASFLGVYTDKVVVILKEAIETPRFKPELEAHA